MPFILVNEIMTHYFLLQHIILFIFQPYKNQFAGLTRFPRSADHIRVNIIIIIYGVVILGGQREGFIDIPLADKCQRIHENASEVMPCAVIHIYCAAFAYAARKLHILKADVNRGP